MCRNDCTYRQIVTPFGRAVILFFESKRRYKNYKVGALGVKKRRRETRRLATAKKSRVSFFYHKNFNARAGAMGMDDPLKFPPIFDHHAKFGYCFSLRDRACRRSEKYGTLGIPHLNGKWLTS